MWTVNGDVALKCNRKIVTNTSNCNILKSQIGAYVSFGTAHIFQTPGWTIFLARLHVIEQRFLFFFFELPTGK